MLVNQIRKPRNPAGTADAVAQVCPEVDAVFAAGFLQAGKGVAAATSCVAARRAADLALLDIFADVILAEVVVQRDVRAIEHQQEPGLVAVQPFEGSRVLQLSMN